MKSSNLQEMEPLMEMQSVYYKNWKEKASHVEEQVLMMNEISKMKRISSEEP